MPREEEEGELCSPALRFLAVQPPPLLTCCLADHLQQEGMEETWAVNVAAPFLLTSELIQLVT